MGLYRALRNFRSSDGRGGTLLLYAGEEVDYDDATVKWVERVAPGTLQPVPPVEAPPKARKK